MNGGNNAFKFPRRRQAGVLAAIHDTREIEGRCRAGTRPWNVRRCSVLSTRMLTIGCAALTLLFSLADGSHARPLRAGRESAPEASCHRVKRGDTLFSISRKYHVPVDELRRINGLDADTTLRAGYTVRLPRRESPKAREAAAPESDRILFRWPLRSVIEFTRDGGDGVRPIGIIITGRPGAPVLSSAQGIVQRIGEMRGYGRYVIVRHESNYLTVYSNLGAVQVRQNQRIPQGRQIGTVDRDEP